MSWHNHDQRSRPPRSKAAQRFEVKLAKLCAALARDLRAIVRKHRQ